MQPGKKKSELLFNDLTCTERLTQSTRPEETNLKSPLGTLWLEGRETPTAVTPSVSFASEWPVILFFCFLQFCTELEI